MVSVYSVRAVNKLQASQSMQQGCAVPQAQNSKCRAAVTPRCSGLAGNTSDHTTDPNKFEAWGKDICSSQFLFSNTSSELVLRKGGSVKDCRENQNILYIPFLTLSPKRVHPVVSLFTFVLQRVWH